MELEKKDYDKLISLMQENKALSNEILWANIFHDSIKNSKWLMEQSFSPGRAAIGYPTLYALYRILDEYQPQNILEMGLGQSTKMIAAYAKWKLERQELCNHYIVEHDREWIAFFKNMYDLSVATDVIQLDLKKVQVETAENQMTEINIYEQFEKTLGNRKYDLIFIDGPFGSPVYSRIDVIDLLPQCLNDSFIIMLDDAERAGEQNTLKMISNILNENGIPYSANYYTGQKATAIITSRDLHFLCTM